MSSAIEMIPETEPFASSTDVLPVNSRPAVELCAGRAAGVVIACPDLVNREKLITLVMLKGLAPMFASSLRETLLLLEHEEVALVLCQPTFDDGDSRMLLMAAAGLRCMPPIIVCADWYEPGAYQEAIELGAFDYLAFPFQRDSVDKAVDQALEEPASHKSVSLRSEMARRASLCCRS